jgi:trimeric autotransporter adhesin
MFRSLRFAEIWFSRRWQLASGRRPNGGVAARGSQMRRNRFRMHPALESVEARILLSSVDLKGASAEPGAEVFRTKKSSVLVTSVSGVGVKGGQAVLTATLTSQGLPLAGKKIFFQVRGRVAGSGVTDGNGVAMRYLANLRNVNVGVYLQGVAAGFAGDSGHKSVIARGRLAVSLLPGTVSSVSASGAFNGVGTVAATLSSRGAQVAGMTIQFQVMGKIVGTAATDSQGVATLANVSFAGLNAGAYANGVTASFGGNLTYTSGTNTGLLVVSPLQVSVSGITAAGKMYDGTTLASVNTSGAVLAGVLAGDDVTLNASAATGTFATKNVGTGINVTVSGLTLAGPNAGDYVVGQPTVTANITAAPVAVVGITAANKPFDGTTTAVLSTGDAALLGVLPGDAVSLNTTDALGTFASPDIGNDITVTISGLTLSGADAANYSLVQPTATADITAGNLTVTGITVNNKVYDANSAATLNTSGATLVGVAPGDDVTLNVSGATGTFTSSNAGSGIEVTISGLTLTGADASKYVLIDPTPTADITPAPLAVTGITAANKVYDGTTVAVPNASGAALVGAVPGDTVTLNSSEATGTFATPNVGTGIGVLIGGLLLAGADAGNYALTEPTTTANITPASIEVSGIIAVSRVYNRTTSAPLLTSGATLIGVVTGDTVALNTSGATGTFATANAGTDINVTVSGLSLTGADAGNYTLTEPSTTADILQASLVVNGITAANKVYDGTTVATLNTSGATVTGVVPGDTVTLVAGGATGAFATADVGTGIDVAVNGLALSGPDAGNYVVVEPTLTANITAAHLTVTGITADNKTFDGTTAATLVTTGAVLMGVVSGDVVTLNVSAAVGTFASTGPGTGITVTISGLTISGSDTGNYILVQPTTTANIT